MSLGKEEPCNEPASRIRIALWIQVARLDLTLVFIPTSGTINSGKAGSRIGLIHVPPVTQSEPTPLLKPSAPKPHLLH